jgi:hypothetical protein
VLHHLLKSIANLEDLAKEGLGRNSAAELERLKLLEQLVRYGVCTCHCHLSTSVYHSAAPCCGNARQAAET